MPAHTNRHEDAVARSFEAWIADGPQARAKAVAAAWTTDGRYTDPLADVSGHERIAVVTATAREFPGVRHPARRGRRRPPRHRALRL
jgi:hypothetical protein